MSNSSSTRKISQEFLDSLKSGELSQLTEMVKNRDDLIMCFRNGYINVYYNSQSIFNIDSSFNVVFNMGHARNTKPNKYKRWCKILEIEVPDIKIKEEKAEFKIPKNGEVFDFSVITDIFIRFTKDFIDVDTPECQVDYYKLAKNETKKNKKSDLTESSHQQEFFNEFFSNNNNLIAYDKEIKFPEVIEQRGKFDGLALRIENNIPVAVVMVEIKSKYDSCYGKDGIAKHLKDFNDIDNNEKAKEWIIESAINILQHYEYLGFIKFNFDINDVSNITKFEKLFVFTTGDARSWTENKNQNDDDYKAYLKLTDSEKMFVNYDN